MRFILLVLSLLSANLSFSQSSIAILRNAEEFERDINNNEAVILDVRTEKEFQLGHIGRAMQANWNDTAQFRERVKYIDPRKLVYVYCLVGARSAAAADWMRRQGFSQVIELQGGINAWKKAGKALEGAKQEKQLTLAEFNASIPVNTNVLVDLGADWCPPCRKMQPVIDALRGEKNMNFTFIKVDAGTQTELLKALDVETIPVFIIYKKGKETWRKQGIVSPEEFKKQLR